MITGFSPTRYWVPPPSNRATDNLRIITDYPPLNPIPMGINPAWWPINPAQQAIINCPAEMVLGGGSSGFGKTDLLVGDGMQEYWLPSFRGLLLRESLGEMDQIEDRMRAAYEPLGAIYRKRTGGGEWEFPLCDEKTRRPVRRKGGARLRYGYLAQDRDIGRYRGNPKSWLGIDESGLQPEKRVRTMIPWLASIDKRLRVRARFASNPGGIGAVWQQAVFLRNRCPLHYPAGKLDDNPMMTSVVPGKVYSGASWKWPPSRSELVHMTTAFFPASVFDNPLYDQSKIDKLKSQTPELQMQLLYGCWCNAESLYFGFMRPEMQVPIQLVPDEWWWNHVISIDYGYGNSAAAAGRYSIDENGRAFGTGEIIEKKMGARDFARKVVDEWVKPKAGEQHHQRVLFVCMDPAMDQHHDVGKSNFEIMAEIFAEYGIISVRSHKAPADNAQNLYSALADQNLIITSAMPQTFNSVSTRIIDDRKAVKKIHGDPLDDLYDQISYFINTWIIESVKPDRLKLQESLQQMQKAGADATALARRSMMETRKIEEKEREKGKGLSLRGRR